MMRQTLLAPRSWLIAVTTVALLAGTIAAVHFGRAGLTLSHYDARGHLIVARRIFDSITPGWQQIGAVWLPLPHLLNALPIQIDALYRTGWSAVALSVVSFTAAAVAVARLVQLTTGSRTAALASAALYILNPNLLYLQATPMTEPLLVALLLWAVILLCASSETTEAPGRSWTVSAVLALACWTRYEAWPVTAAAIGAAAWRHWRRERRASAAARYALQLAVLPLVAIAVFVVFSRVVVGEWFVSGGFFVPEPRSLGHPLVVAGDMLWGVRALTGTAVMVAGMAGLCVVIVRGLLREERSRELVMAALVMTLALPFIAFLDGHPYRVRYMVPLLASTAIGCGVLIALVPRGRALAAAALVAIALIERPPLDAGAAMVQEAQWDLPNVARRLPMTDYLRARYSGETIMASMGSLGHYMQELSGAGLQVRDFLHEGNGDLWLRALNRPRPIVGWILIDEQGEGGDMLARIARENPKFLDGFTRVADAAGIALYERQNRTLNVAR